MATTCNFGQIPDIRFTTLCCKSKMVIDRNCNLDIANATIDRTLAIQPSGNLNAPGATVDMRNTLFDVTGSEIIGFNGNISGNIIADEIRGTLVHVNIFGDILGNILGNVNNINGNILGEINGNIDVLLLFGNIINVNTAILDVFVANIAQINQITQSLCIPDGSAVIMKTGSELQGNICLPSGSSITFKRNANVIIDTAFGTNSDGDILYHANGITTVLPAGNTNTVLTSGNDTIFYANDLILDIINVGNIKGNFQVGANADITDVNFINLTANDLVANIFIKTPLILGNKFFGNLCGNVTSSTIFDDLGNANAKVLVTGNIDQDILLGLLRTKGQVIANSVFVNPGSLLFAGNGLIIGGSQDITLTSHDFVVCDGNLISPSYRFKDGTIVISESEVLSNVDIVSVDETILIIEDGNITPNLLGNDTIISETISIEQDAYVCGNLWTQSVCPKTGGGNCVVIPKSIIILDQIGNVTDVNIYRGNVQMKCGNLCLNQNWKFENNVFIEQTTDGNLTVVDANVKMDGNLIVCENLVFDSSFLPGPVFARATGSVISANTPATNPSLVSNWVLPDFSAGDFAIGGGGNSIIFIPPATFVPSLYLVSVTAQWTGSDVTFLDNTVHVTRLLKNAVLLEEANEEFYVADLVLNDHQQYISRLTTIEPGDTFSVEVGYGAILPNIVGNARDVSVIFNTHRHT